METSLSILKQLEHRELSSVVFVRDYWQLDFDGPGLTILNNPKVKIDDLTWIQHNDKEFCYFLVQCIGKNVEEIYFEEKSFFQIRFQNNFLFFVSLKPEDYLFNSPEALMYHDNNHVSAVW
jgi:hypothetical protein